MEMNDYFDMTKIKNFYFIRKYNSKIFVDPDAESFIWNDTDYVEEDWNKGVFENKFIFIPDKDLVSSCGCGISFTPKN